jgi:hypothetical protein
VALIMLSRLQALRYQPVRTAALLVLCTQTGWCDIPARAAGDAVDYHDPAQNYWRDRLASAQVSVRQSGCRHGLSFGSRGQGCTERSIRRLYCEAKLTAKDIAPLEAIATWDAQRPTADTAVVQCATLLVAELESSGIEEEQERSCQHWYAPWNDGPH